METITNSVLDMSYFKNLPSCFQNTEFSEIVEKMLVLNQEKYRVLTLLENDFLQPIYQQKNHNIGVLCSIIKSFPPSAEKYNFVAWVHRYAKAKDMHKIYSVLLREETIINEFTPDEFSSEDYITACHRVKYLEAEYDKYWKFIEEKYIMPLVRFKNSEALFNLYSSVQDNDLHLLKTDILDYYRQVCPIKNFKI